MPASVQELELVQIEFPCGENYVRKLHMTLKGTGILYFLFTILSSLLLQEGAVGLFYFFPICHSMLCAFYAKQY